MAGKRTLQQVTIPYTKNLYKIVDLLNRTLKKDDLMFGIALDKHDETQAIFTIYHT